MEALKLNNLSIAIDQEMNQKVNSFPFEIFPEFIQELIEDANNTVIFDREYFSAGILSTCATAIGNSIMLNNGSYTVKPIFWLVIVGSRGTGKTAPLEFAKRPISFEDNKAYELYHSAFNEYRQLPKDTRGNPPVYAKFIIEDFTPEKLAETLQANRKGVLIFNDELMRWINTFDQYKKGGDQQLYLNLWNGSTLTVDRVTKEPIRVDKTNVNILGGMQPEKLAEFAKNGRNHDGFLDRFLFIIPEHSKPYLFTGLSINKKLEEKFNSFISKLLQADENTLTVDKKGIQFYKDWQHQKSKECFNDQIETAIQSKLETYVWRFTLLIDIMAQASNDNFNNSIHPESIKKAIKLAEYFRYNALKVHDQYLTSNPLAGLTTIQLDVYKALPQEFKRVEVLPIFENNGLKGGTIDRFLNRKQLFENLKYGHYKKKL